MLIRHDAVHVGIATQTPDGLKVPVVRHAEARGLWDLAAEIRRVSEAARTNKATREELSGSTITVTSLGKLGGIVSTPIINAPELAIIGVNKAVERPVVVGGAVAMRLHDEPVFVVRSSIRRRLRRRRHDPGAQGDARAPGHHLHSGIDAHERSDRRITLQGNHEGDDGYRAPGPGSAPCSPTTCRSRTFKDGRWSAAQLLPTAPIPMHPAAHVLHYASTCFEGFKAYRWRDGSVHVFRMDRHIERMRQSARLLTMPEPDAEQLGGDGDLGHRSLP